MERVFLPCRKFFLRFLRGGVEVEKAPSGFARRPRGAFRFWRVLRKRPGGKDDFVPTRILRAPRATAAGTAPGIMDNDMT
jgi:hypothetical protein